MEIISKSQPILDVSYLVYIGPLGILRIHDHYVSQIPYETNNVANYAMF